VSQIERRLGSIIVELYGRQPYFEKELRSQRLAIVRRLHTRSLQHLLSGHTASLSPFRFCRRGHYQSRRPEQATGIDLSQRQPVRISPCDQRPRRRFSGVSTLVFCRGSRGSPFLPSPQNPCSQLVQKRDGLTHCACARTRHWMKAELSL
jgi:hypothetical protein